ncbi:MAG: hypothetical protein VX823_02415, partial [Actinomycetota bacterium]|nr:hypothetical protein [Actinomycetota bacterium]
RLCFNFKKIYGNEKDLGVGAKLVGEITWSPRLRLPDNPNDRNMYRLIAMLKPNEGSPTAMFTRWVSDIW